MSQLANKKDFENLCGVDSLVNIFADLISYDTKATLNTKNVPSSIGQLRLGAHILNLLSKLNLPCEQTKDGVIICTIPASKGFEQAKSLALFAHLDTAPDASGENVNAMLVKNYQGGNIELANGLVIDDKISPALKNHVNEDIIVTDGTTLLGADDKAGVSILLSIAQNLVTKDLNHGKIVIVFSVDEEIGKSSDYIDVEKLGCDFGVTIDGTNVGDLDIATFNAMMCKVTVDGVSIHTGCAYKKMKNALNICCEFVQNLPVNELPQTTKDLDGFYHAYNMQGSVQSAFCDILLRDFKDDGLQKRVAYLTDLATFLNQKYDHCIKLEFINQYKNMQLVLQEHPLIVDLCKKAYADANIDVHEQYIRGGTDGSNLSFKGLPCPNIFTGGLNCHGPYECLPVNAFHSAYQVVENLIKEVALYKGK